MRTTDAVSRVLPTSSARAAASRASGHPCRRAARFTEGTLSSPKPGACEAPLATPVAPGLRRLRLRRSVVLVTSGVGVQRDVGAGVVAQKSSTTYHPARAETECPSS